MAQAQKTQTKVAVKPAKAAPKAAPKVAQKAATKPAAKAAPKTTAKVTTLATTIVEGIAQRIAAGSPFYRTALAYHARNKTLFPRARNDAARAALTEADVVQVFDQHDKRILAAGSQKGQAMLDVYMMAR